MVLDLIRPRAASYLNGFKSIPGKAFVNRVHNNMLFVGMLEISIIA